MKQATTRRGIWGWLTGWKRSSRIGQTGRWAERLAENHLRRHHYRILWRNLRVAGGELDLVAIDPDRKTVVVIEVKASRSTDTARWSPEMHANHAKRQQLLRLTQALGQRRDLRGHPMRIDLITVVQANESIAPTITHTPNFVTL